MKASIAILALSACLFAAPASAQLPQLPSLPPVGEVLNDATATGGEALNQVDLRNLRRTRIRYLLRRHRRELEPDPQGQPIVRSQLLALSPSAAALEGARAAGFAIVNSEEIGDFGAMVTLRAPVGMPTRRALRRLRDADPHGTYDFDHLHLESGPAGKQGVQGGGRGGPRIGLIDSGVSGPVAAQRAFASSAPVAAAHGATVAGLLQSAAPGARLYVADIYGGAPTGGASSAMARALAWLAQERTPVVNISLVGPRNRVIEALVARLTARGFVIVAAVGNDGPAAAPLYPAAYEGVIGVTAVDARRRVLIEAARGPQVDFAAPGVVGEGRRAVRGTSYAAPIVAGLLAAHIDTPDTGRARNALAALRSAARDLGARGRDDTYGEGLLQLGQGQVAAH